MSRSCLMRAGVSSSFNAVVFASSSNGRSSCGFFCSFTRVWIKSFLPLATSAATFSSVQLLPGSGSLVGGPTRGGGAVVAPVGAGEVPVAALGETTLAAAPAAAGVAAVVAPASAPASLPAVAADCEAAGAPAAVAPAVAPASAPAIAPVAGGRRRAGQQTVDRQIPGTFFLNRSGRILDIASHSPRQSSETRLPVSMVLSGVGLIVTTNSF